MERVFWRLLLLLALRPGEVMKLRWSWIDRDVLTIPGSEVKNGRTHSLYLSALAREVLDNLRKKTGDGTFLFPSVRGDSHRLDFTNSQNLLQTAMECPDWTARDIRRTCETQMRTFLRDGEGVSRVLNHDVSAIRKHYDRNDYFDRKKEVLDKWTQWIANLLKEENEKVVKLSDYR
jgi:integrase